MAPIFHSRYMTISILFLLSVCSGCFGTSPSAKHYLLSPMEESSIHAEKTAVNLKSLRIAVGPVVFPKYLDRPQMVFRKEDHHVVIDQFNRWAEPLADNFTRVMVENLTQLLDSDFIRTYPVKKKSPVDYRISINVNRFDAVPGREAVLSLNWRIHSGIDRSLLLEKRYTVRKQLNTDSTTETVSALNETINDFSREIAATITKQQP